MSDTVADGPSAGSADSAAVGSTTLPPRGDKRRVRQSAYRAHYDQASLHAVLDAASIGHVSFVHDGWPQSIPTAIARLDDYLYMHGSRSSRLYKAMAGGERVCVSVCLVDGLVKARSAFHCSMNYRSAVVFGCCETIEGQQKHDLLERFTEHLIPGSAGDFRPMLAKELKATELVRLPLSEASVKIRQGGPIDDEEDLQLPYWAGVIPLDTVARSPQPAADLPDGIEPPRTLIDTGLMHRC